MNSLFDGVDFAFGEMRGKRAFRVTKTGKLTAVVAWKHSPPITSGVNVASCLDDYRRAQWYIQGGTVVRFQPEDPKYDSNTHVPGQLGCSCGFYAYYSGTNDYHEASTDHTIQAIVKGHGRVTHGDRGFRCGKMELVALVKPDFGEDHPKKRLRDLPRRQKMQAGLHVAWCGGFGLWTTYSMISNLDSDAWWSTLFAAINIAFLFTLAAIVHPLYTDKLVPLLVRRKSEMYPIFPKTWKRVRKNYPDVPVYDSLAEAEAAHPLTVPDVPDAARSTRGSGTTYVQNAFWHGYLNSLGLGQPGSKPVVHVRVNKQGRLVVASDDDDEDDE